MAFLVTAVVLVGALCAVDLLLTFAVIRRLREHTRLLSTASGGPPAGIGVGEEVGGFTVSTVDGEQLSDVSVSDGTVVAFLSVSCQPCREKLPALVRYAGAVPGGRDRVLAVVVGDAGEAEAFVAELRPVSRVVVEGYGGPVGAAFKTRAYPSILQVGRSGQDRLVVTADRVDLDRVAAAA